MKIKRTNSSDPDFIFLVKQLDLFLSDYNGDADDFYREFNQIKLDNCVIVYIDDQPVGCGAFKIIDTEIVEIKRMFTLPEFRNRNVGGTMLEELEKWAFEIGYNTFILETGSQLYNAIKLYQKMGYKITDNYGQYKGNDKSVCFMKRKIAP